MENVEFWVGLLVLVLGGGIGWGDMRRSINALRSVVESDQKQRAVELSDTREWLKSLQRKTDATDKALGTLVAVMNDREDRRKSEQ